jgi:hypothetical protein
MGTTGGNRIARVLHSTDPRRYDGVDRVFALGFGLVVAGAFTVFWTESTSVAVASMVGMFLGFCIMVLCMGFEDLLGDKEKRGTEDEKKVVAVDGFKGGDAFEEREGMRGTRNDPNKKV